MMKQLIEDIAKALVDIPEEVSVREVQGEQVTVLELKVAPSDLGKVIGRQGRTAAALRTCSSWPQVLHFTSTYFTSSSSFRRSQPSGTMIS